MAQMRLVGEEEFTHADAVELQRLYAVYQKAEERVAVAMKKVEAHEISETEFERVQLECRVEIDAYLDAT